MIDSLFFLPFFSFVPSTCRRSVFLSVVSNGHRNRRCYDSFLIFKETMPLNGSAHVAYVTRYTEDWLYINTTAYIRSLCCGCRFVTGPASGHQRLGRETVASEERRGCLSRVNICCRISPPRLLSCHRLAVRRRFSAMRTPIPRRQWLLLPVQVPPPPPQRLVNRKM